MNDFFKRVDRVRVQNPLIHVLTNQVVMNDSANGLLAVGASPFMSNEPAEMPEVAALADAIVLNIGTITSHQLIAMKKVGQLANQFNKPLVLDPVGVGATSFRKKAVAELLQVVKPTLIRGNAGEIAALCDYEWQAKGVEAGSGSADVTEIALSAARNYQTLIALSGPQDIVTDGNQLFKINNGTSAFTKMTGAGCLLTCLCAAYLAEETQQQLAQVAAACAMYAVCGELTAQALVLPAVGSFRTKLLDQLSTIDSRTVAENVHMERMIR